MILKWENTPKPVFASMNQLSRSSYFLHVYQDDYSIVPMQTKAKNVAAKIQETLPLDTLLELSALLPKFQMVFSIL